VNTATPANVLVSNNGRALLDPAGGPFNLKGSGGQLTGHVIVFGLSGNDFIQTPGNVSAEVHCGNDTVYGGAGNDVLLGGRGNDYLKAGRGDSILISGGGNTYLVGGSCTYLLIAGQLVPTGQQPFPTYNYLKNVLAGWRTGDTTGVHAMFLEYVHADRPSAQCTLVGGTGRDASFYRQNSTAGHADLLAGACMAAVTSKSSEPALELADKLQRAGAGRTGTPFSQERIRWPRKSLSRFWQRPRSNPTIGRTN
jgi:hypothetical protein